MADEKKVACNELGMTRFSRDYSSKYPQLWCRDFSDEIMEFHYYHTTEPKSSDANDYKDIL